MEDMNQSKKDIFCKNALYKYIECLKLNINVFGSEHGPPMCDYLRDIVEFSKCDIIKYTDKRVDSIDELNHLV